MAITASQVKELREKTGVGMMECKKALQETHGDMEKAILYLRERGLSRAAKKSGRIAAEGLVEVYVNEDQNAGVLLELNCETDFVSKNDEFREFVHNIATLALKNQVSTIEQLENLTLGTTTIKDALTAMIAKIGENMKLRRVQVMSSENGMLVGYSHMGGKIGTLVHLEGAKGDQVLELGKDLAMHTAAAAPRYLNSKEVDPRELDQEKEIARKKLLEEGKPENMIDKILIGQMNKFYKEVCLLDQPFVKEPKLSVAKHVDSSGLGVSVAGFTRYQLGEGIEKKQENFADEVAAAAKGG